MYGANTIKVIIPAFNEEGGVGLVVQELIQEEGIDEIVVVDNASTDNTAKVAKEAGATVLKETIKGYGIACLRGIEYLSLQEPKPDIVVFIDADHSDFANEVSMLVHPIINSETEIVIGSRVLGKKEKGSMTIQQSFGNWLATTLLRVIYKVKYTDLGPFRAIRFNSLENLGMKDLNYGWTVEMQLKAAKQKLKYKEVPVSYRKRIGKSKVSGTVKGTLMAGYKILWTIFKYM